MPLLDVVFEALDRCQISLAQFITMLLTHQEYEDHQFVVDLLEHSNQVFNAFLQHPASRAQFTQKSFSVVENMYLQELCCLASEDNGLHFRASSTSTEQLENFSLTAMAQKMEVNAPKWWWLLGTLLDDKATADLTGQKDGGGDESVDDAREIEGDDDEYWDEVDEIDLEGIINGLTGELGMCLAMTDKHAKRHAAIKLMRKTIITSILMNGWNQKSNALQSLLGLFLQSAHTPYKVIDTLAHLGISVSADTINMAVQSLSKESHNSLQRLGRSLLASYAYDNFDVDLKTHTPTVEKSNDSLKHLTSGLLFLLVHGVTLNDLKCSEELWRKSALNLQADEPYSLPKLVWWDLLKLHPEWMDPNSKLSHHDQFNAWAFLVDLCTNGPEYFHQFKSMIQDLHPMEQIPTVKTPIYAARAMDINNSTVSGNIQAVTELLAQGGLADPMAVLEENMDFNSPNISEYVILVHGDLGTGERLQATQLRRSIECTSWNCLQHVIFIPGLFHLKMACADAIWQCFISPMAACEDKTSLMHNVAQLRPKETGIYTTKPGFRQIHELVGHAGVCRRLDCWRVHAAKNSRFSSLEDFALSKPTLDDLRAMANEICRTYIANHQLDRMHRKHESERDLQFENALLLNNVNSGDIGHVETCIVSWIPILKAIGKHKYASHMTNFLFNVHFVYPPGLWRAVRYHILINPTSRPMKWRAVDWCVELNNLFTKVKNGGKNSNRSVDRIILESPLVQVYQNLQGLVQQSFGHMHLTTNHAAPNMRKTFAKLQERLTLNSLHVVLAGRKSQYLIDNLSEKGQGMMEKAAEQGDLLVENESEIMEEGDGLGDIIGELL
ncbi:hypothetical protein EV401DRAFT_2070333 [Pisolithus croceorrhizus]|nr:hypothetical protein EV401DRAFT_2070333 [Pisolithus croceorrhizus]